MKNRLKEVREKKGYTLQEVANALKIGNNTISRYENSKREPKLETWQKLAKFYDTSVPYLQGIDSPKQDNCPYCHDDSENIIDDDYTDKIYNEWYEGIEIYIRKGKLSYRSSYYDYIDDSKSGDLNGSRKINFCPMCGRRLTND